MRRLLLLGLGLTLLIVVGLFVYGQWGRTAGLAPPSGLAAQGATARQALAPAAELAAQWREDAGLTAASCTRPAIGMQSADEIEWAFQFFSPSTQRFALITVTGGEALMIRESLSPYAMPTFSAERWPVDSDRALQVWLDRGGSTVVERRPDADVAMQLRMLEKGDEHPVWIVAGLVGGGESVFMVTVDATDGTVVEP